MANPLTAAQQALSDSLVAEGWWDWTNCTGCPVVVRKTSWPADEWHRGHITDVGDVMDHNDCAEDDVSAHDGGVYVDFTRHALAGVLMQLLKEAAGTERIKGGWTAANGWDMAHTASGTITSKTGETVLAENLASLLIAAR